MSFLARAFSQVVARSATTTTTFLLKPGHARSLALRSASTESSKQSNQLKIL
jgi:hypothetical protein